MSSPFTHKPPPTPSTPNAPPHTPVNRPPPTTPITITITTTPTTSATLLPPPPPHTPLHRRRLQRPRPNPTAHLLHTKLAHLRTPLAPIRRVTPRGETDPPHPAYPPTLLAYWLLTEPQLDAMAAYYHQAGPDRRFGHAYPAAMRWDERFLGAPDRAPPPLPPSTKRGRAEGVDCDGHEVEDEDGDDAGLTVEERVRIKRRKFGAFIGLRGCDTPLWEVERELRFLRGRARREARLEREAEEARKWV